MKKLFNFFKKNKSAKSGNAKQDKIIYDEYFVHYLDDGRPFAYLAVNYKEQIVVMVCCVRSFNLQYEIKDGVMAHLEGTNQISKEIFLQQYDIAIDYLSKTARP